MLHQHTKNAFIIDHDENYIPVVTTVDGETQVEANFSLAEQSMRSSERLQLLIDFIRRHNHNSIHRHHNCGSVGVSHRLAAQVLYLAYWENYLLEFKIERDLTIRILIRFKHHPELTFTLDLFEDGIDPYGEIQCWWDFVCETISAHADIWEILLEVDENVYRRLKPGDFPRVQVEIVRPLCKAEPLG